MPTIAVGAISEADQVNGIIASGRADLCALARPTWRTPRGCCAKPRDWATATLSGPQPTCGARTRWKAASAALRLALERTRPYSGDDRCRKLRMTSTGKAWPAEPTWPDTPELRRVLRGAGEVRDRGAVDGGQQDRALAAEVGLGADVLALSRSARATCCVRSELGHAREGRPPGDLSEQPGPSRRLGSGRLAVLRAAGDAPGRAGVCARAFGVGTALHHGRAGRLHHRRRPQDDARAPTTSCLRPTAPGTSTA